MVTSSHRNFINWQPIYVYYFVTNGSILYTTSIWFMPQVWPVSDSKVIKGYEQFLNRLMCFIGVIFIVTFAIILPQYSFFGLIFFLVGWLTIRNITKKLKYQESLLTD